MISKKFIHPDYVLPEMHRYYISIAEFKLNIFHARSYFRLDGGGKAHKVLGILGFNFVEWGIIKYPWIRK